MGIHNTVQGINKKECILAGFCKLLLKEIDTKNNSCGTSYFIPSNNYYYYLGSPILVTSHYIHFKSKSSLKLSFSALSGSLEGEKCRVRKIFLRSEYVLKFLVKKFLECLKLHIYFNCPTPSE